MTVKPLILFFLSLPIIWLPFLGELMLRRRITSYINIRLPPLGLMLTVCVTASFLAALAFMIRNDYLPATKLVFALAVANFPILTVWSLQMNRAPWAKSLFRVVALSVSIALAAWLFLGADLILFPAIAVLFAGVLRLTSLCFVLAIALGEIEYLSFQIASLRADLSQRTQSTSRFSNADRKAA